MTPGGSPSARESESLRDPARFVEEFARGWAGPDAGALLDLLHPDVQLRQPMFAPTTGREMAAALLFGPLFRFLPDLRLAVVRWSTADDTVFIEWTASATLGGRPLRWSGVDRFTLADGRAIERVAYFDAVPLLVAVLRRPSTWLSFVRSGAARSWRQILAPPAPAAPGD